MRKCTAQKIEALAVEFGMHEREAGNIPARPREADGESALYRVHQYRGDNRNVAVRVIGGGNAFYDDDVDWE
jgi:hypothetical protein